MKKITFKILDSAPKEFFRFAHSSSLSDAQAGFKGYNHKILLRALAGGASERPDVLVITPASTYEKYKIQSSKGKPIIPRFMKFSVDKGLRFAYEQQFTPDGKPWMIDKKFVYKEIPSTGASYETSLTSIFVALFGNADNKDLPKMWSYVGVIDLMKKYLKQSQIDETFERLLDLQWGPGAQGIERDDALTDLKIKAGGANYMIKKLKLSKYQKKMDEMIKVYYENYGKKKITEAKSFRDFLKEDGTVSGDIATVPARFPGVCKRHGVKNCKICNSQKGK